MDKALIIYDLSGKVWSITYGETEVPQGVPAVWCDIPPGAIVDHVDVATGTVVFEYLPDSDLGTFQKQIKDIQNYVDSIGSMIDNISNTANDASSTAELAARNASEANESIENARGEIADVQATAQLAAENASSANTLAEGNGADITALQEALVEVYEMLIGGEA